MCDELTVLTLVIFVISCLMCTRVLFMDRELDICKWCLQCELIVTAVLIAVIVIFRCKLIWCATVFMSYSFKLNVVFYRLFHGFKQWSTEDKSTIYSTLLKNIFPYFSDLCWFFSTLQHRTSINHYLTLFKSIFPYFSDLWWLCFHSTTQLHSYIFSFYPLSAQTALLPLMSQFLS